MYKASIKALSIDEAHNELMTVEITFPRFVLPEFNTHKMLEKNTSSSRAIPIKKMIEIVRDNPVVPIAWQKRHSGMQGTEYITNPDTIAFRELQWLTARDRALQSAESMSTDFEGKEDPEGVTKQLCNRLLEPFMWTTMLVTGTIKDGWNNFFNLRCPKYLMPERMENSEMYDPEDKYDLAKSWHELVGWADNLDDGFELREMEELDRLKHNKAQGDIHISKIAELIYDAYMLEEAVPKEAGDWHIPYFNDYKNIDYGFEPEVLAKISTSMAARTSYTTIEGGREVSPKRHLGLYDKLLSYDPPHSSPLSHASLTMSEEERQLYTKTYMKEDEDTGVMMKVTEEGWCRNIRGFIPLRHLVESKIK